MNSTKLNEFLQKRGRGEKENLYSLDPCHHRRGSSSCSHRIRRSVSSPRIIWKISRDDFDDDFDDGFFEDEDDNENNP